MTQKVNIVISGDAKGLKSSLSDAEKALSKFSSSSEQSLSKIVAISATLGTVIANVVTKAFNSLSSSLDGAVKRLDTLNNFPRVMSNLGQSAQDSEKAIAYLNERLLGLPTTIDSAAEAVQGFTAINGNVKASTEIYLALNNALLASGKSMEEQRQAMVQLTQAYAKGKPDFLEYRKFFEVMPAQMNQIAQAMGYTSGAMGGDLQQAFKDGKVTMSDFMKTAVRLNQEGINGFANFEEQARNATGGVETSIVNLKTAITRGIANVMNTLKQSNISGFFNGIASAVNRVTVYVQAFVTVMMKAWAVVAGLFGKKTAGTAQSIANSVNSAGAGAGGLADSAQDASSALGSAGKNAKKLKDQLANFDEMNVLKEPDTSSSGGGAGGGVGADVSGIDVSGLDDITGKVDEVVDKIAEKLSWLQPIFEKVFTAGRQAVENIKNALAEVDWKTFAEIAGNIITFVIGLLEGMITTYINFYNAVAPTIQKISAWLAEHGVTIGEIVAKLTILKTIFKVLTSPIKTVLGLVGKLGTALKGWKEVSPLITAVKDKFSALGTVYKSLNAKMVDIGKTIGTAIKSPLQSLEGLFLRIKEGGSNLFSTLWGGIKNLSSSMLEIVSHPLESLKAGIGLLKNGISGLWSVISANPLTVILTLVALAIASSEELRATLGELLKACLQPLMAIFDVLKAVLEPIMGILKTVGEVVATILIPPLQILTEVIKFIAQGIEALAGVITAILTPVSSFVGWLGSLFGITNDNNTATQNLTESEREAQRISDARARAVENEREEMEALERAVRGVNDANLDLVNAEQNLRSSTKDLTEKAKANNMTTEEAVAWYKKLDADTLKSLNDTELELAETVGNYMNAQDKLKDSTDKLKQAKEEQTSAEDGLYDAQQRELRALLDEKAQVYANQKDWEGLKNMLVQLADNEYDFVDAQGNAVHRSREEMAWLTSGVADDMANAYADWKKVWHDFPVSVREDGNTIVNHIKGLDTSVAGEMKKVGVDGGQGYINGMRSQYNAAWNTGYGLTQQGVLGGKAGQKSNSPSKLARELGEFLGEGYIEGIENEMKETYKTAYDLSEGAVKAISENALDDLELNVVAKVDDSDVFKLTDTIEKVSADSKIGLTADGEVELGSKEPTQVIVKIGDETLLDRIIDGINGKTSLRNRSVINV